jgi:putative phosphoesterase
MRIGILSDTHNQVGNLLAALRVFRAEGVTRLIHCGDMANTFTAGQMSGFDVIYVNGNSDESAEAVNHILWTLNPANETPGKQYTGKIEGVRIAATHSDMPQRLESLIKSRRYAYVFHGHTHRARDEFIGKTRVINPGALGGARYEPRTVCVLDLATGENRFITVANY